jgi:hypothetical protein
MKTILLGFVFLTCSPAVLAQNFDYRHPSQGTTAAHRTTMTVDNWRTKGNVNPIQVNRNRCYRTSPFSRKMT